MLGNQDTCKAHTLDEEEALLGRPQQPRSRGCLGREYFPCVPARYVLAVISCLGFVNVYALRVNLSVAMVEMDNDTTEHSGSARVFEWTKPQQGWVLSAFFYGYLLTQIPGGWLAQRVGGKWVFGVGVLMTSVFTLLTPLAADTSVWVLVVVRILEGFFEGVTFPAVHAMWGKWAPPLERTKLSTITYTGPYLGSIISFPLSAVLCKYGFDGGWPSVFYIFGAVGILWFVAWVFLAYSSPATHPRISKEEREYIESSIAAGSIGYIEAPTPWFKIFTSPAVWAIVVAHTCNTWGSYTFLTCMPTYFQQALPQLQVGSNSIVLNGTYSAIPYIVYALCAIPSGQVADFLRATCQIPTGIVRKLFTTASFAGSAIFLIICAYLGTSTVTAVLFVTLGVGLGGVALAGFSINHLDIAPRYAGVLMGITNSAATLSGIVAPQVAKAITVTPSAPKNSEAYLSDYRDEWREVFIIVAEIYIFGALVYIILGSGKKQPWADGPRDSNKRNQNVQYHQSSDVEEQDKKWKSSRTALEKKIEANGINGTPNSGFSDHDDSSGTI